MNLSDLFVRRPIGSLRYVPPCESGWFNDYGTPIGYYVDDIGRKFSQETIEGMQNPKFDIPYVNIPREESTSEFLQREYGEDYWKATWNSTQKAASRAEVIDVTFEEVK